MCRRRTVQFGCGHQQDVWRYEYDLGSRPTVYSHSRKANVPLCPKLEYDVEPVSVDNCCSFECCARDIEEQQHNVRNWEAILAIRPGSRYGQEFSESILEALKGPLRHQQKSDVDFAREAHMFSFQRAQQHLDGCSQVIIPGADMSAGKLTKAMHQLSGKESLDSYMTMQQQHSRIWHAFTPDIVQGVLAAAYKTSIDVVVEGMKQTLQNLEIYRSNGGSIKAKLIYELIWCGVEDRQRPHGTLQHAPPDPNLTRHLNKRRADCMVLFSDPRLAPQIGLRSKPIQRYREVFFGQIVDLENFGTIELAGWGPVE